MRTLSTTEDRTMDGGYLSAGVPFNKLQMTLFECAVSKTQTITLLSYKAL